MNVEEELRIRLSEGFISLSLTQQAIENECRILEERKGDLKGDEYLKLLYYRSLVADKTNNLEETNITNVHFNPIDINKVILSYSSISKRTNKLLSFELIGTNNSKEIEISIQPSYFLKEVDRKLINGRQFNSLRELTQTLQLGEINSA